MNPVTYWTDDLNALVTWWPQWSGNLMNPQTRFNAWHVETRLRRAENRCLTITLSKRLPWSFPMINICPCSTISFHDQCAFMLNLFPCSYSIFFHDVHVHSVVSVINMWSCSINVHAQSFSVINMRSCSICFHDQYVIMFNFFPWSICLQVQSYSITNMCSCSLFFPWSIWVLLQSFPSSISLSCSRCFRDEYVVMVNLFLLSICVHVPISWWTCIP